MELRNYGWFTRALLIAWLLVNSLSPAFAGVGEVEKRVFHYGARLRREHYPRAREHYVMAREALVEKGKAIIPFLERKTESPDSRERLFAKILISRINDPQMVEAWHKNLMSLVGKYEVLNAVRKHRQINWDKLPRKAVDVPASHLADVLWEYGSDGSAGDREVTAVALQFYLAPDMEVLDAIVEAVPSDYALSRLAKRAIVKLGNPAVPQMREVLSKTVKMQPSVPWGSPNITQEQRKVWHKYRRQTSRTRVAAYVLSRLNNRESIPLMAKCLTGRFTNHEYIEELSADLAQMKAVEAVDSMLDCTLRSAVNRWYKGNNERPGYVVLRSHVKSLGQQVLPVLRDRLSATEKEGEKVVLTNLIAELSGVKGKKKEVAELRESLWFDTTTVDLLKLRELTAEDIFPRLTELILRKRRPVYGIARQVDERTAACLALGTLKETRAVPMLAEELRKLHEYLEKMLSNRKIQKNAKPFDAQKAREAGYTFGRRETNMAQILAWGDTCLLALRRIGGNEAKEVVAAAARYSEYETRAEISLLLMEGKADEIAEHLQSDDPALREEAALVFLERQDKRATRELLCATARRQGPSHEQWKKYALSSRKDISSILRELAKSDSVREQVLAAAMIIEIQSPEKAKKCNKLLQDAATQVSMMHVQYIGMVERAGRGLAKKLDESYVPLVEAKCVFGQGVIRRGVAAYALAEFKKPRSMHVLAESFNMGSLEGSNPAALALADYGEKGAELAAKVPPPMPGEHDTGLRMTMHRGGVRVLAEQKDIRGVDEILKGLATLKKDRSLDMWSHRMGIYLGAAGKFHDKRLVEPILQILATSEKPESYHHAQVIHILSAYDDERLVPLFTKRLGTLNPKKQYPARDTLYGPALTALTRRLGENTPEYLIKQFNESRNDKIRAAALLALGELSYPNRPAYPGKARWSVERFNKKEDREKVASEVRKLAYPVLVEALKDPSADVNRMAALGLTILAAGNKYDSIGPDLRAVGPLTEWCRTQNKSFFSLTRYLGANGNAESGKVLLAVLKSQPPTKGDAQIVFALKKLKPKGAVPVLVRNIRARALKCKRWYMGEGRELEALAEFGKEGAYSLLEIFSSTDNLAYKIKSAHLLGEVGNKQATDAIATFLPNLIAAGTENPKLILGDNEDRDDTYIRSCGTLFEALQKLDKDRAKEIAETVLLRGPEALRRVSLKVWSDSK